MILTTIPTIEFILFIHRHRPPPLTTIASIDIIRRGSSPPLQGDQLPLTPVIVISLFLPPVYDAADFQMQLFSGCRIVL
ncbi:unnamed protein product [Linum tenue]|uniref:Uncharacterized protein n=1 Tax=Linum tenue TaxID=586396 RepID=A0AAV0PFC3_9ROSI|nr:unnamed protein product [Linum tenue]